MRSLHKLLLPALAALLVFSAAGEARAERLGIAINDGSGRFGPTGGHLAVGYDTLRPHDLIGYRVLSGSFNYWTIYARYANRAWKRIYRGRENFIPMRRIWQLVAQRGRGRPTHLSFTVNGGRRRHEPRACQLAIIRRHHRAAPPPPPPPPPPRYTPPRPPRAYHLFRAIPKQSSAVFRRYRRHKLRVATRTFDPVPYRMAPPSRQVVTVHPGQRVFLAGDPSGRRRFAVDNFLLITIGERGAKRRFVVGSVEPVSYRGRPVPRLGHNKFRFRAGEIDLTPYIPRNLPTRIKVEALDYGGVGMLTELYLIVQ